MGPIRQQQYVDRRATHDMEAFFSIIRYHFSRVNRRARRRLVAIIHDYRYLADGHNG
jgi:hypothetical protein